MTDINRDQNQESRTNTGQQGNTGSQPGSQTSNTSSGTGKEENNPQEGKEWSNYRTRELSTAEEHGGGEGNATTPGNE